MGLTADITNAHEVIRGLRLAEHQIEAHLGRMMYRIGAAVKDTAVKYAPKSPTQAEKRKASTATAAQWKAAKARRNARSTTRAAPGGLMRSIAFKSDRNSAEIFVAANSEAGKYAFAIHELKGVTWHNRGVGTVAKGAKADEKFIERAIADKEDAIRAIAEDQMNKAITQANGS